MAKQDIGIIGLGVMGQNLALNMVGNGFAVAGYDLDEQKRRQLAEKAAGEKIAVHPTITDFLAHLATPRRILIMVPAGKAVDAVIGELLPLLAPGDVLADGGNSHFMDTGPGLKKLEAYGIFYVDSGISGGEESALLGPSIMPGGNGAAWPDLKDILQQIAARAPDGSPCCAWIGPGRAGHFVKMVDNGIEYADMQMIAEAYFLMEWILNVSASEMAAVFEEWNRGELNSYLIQITADILKKKEGRGDGGAACQCNPRHGRTKRHRKVDEPDSAGPGGARSSHFRGSIRPDNERSKEGEGCSGAIVRRA